MTDRELLDAVNSALEMLRVALNEAEAAGLKVDFLESLTGNISLPRGAGEIPVTRATAIRRYE